VYDVADLLVALKDYSQLSPHHKRVDSMPALSALVIDSEPDEDESTSRSAVNGNLRKSLQSTGGGEGSGRNSNYSRQASKGRTIGGASMGDFGAIMGKHRSPDSQQKSGYPAEKAISEQPRRNVSSGYPQAKASSYDKKPSVIKEDSEKNSSEGSV